MKKKILTAAIAVLTAVQSIALTGCSTNNNKESESGAKASVNSTEESAGKANSSDESESSETEESSKTAEKSQMDDSEYEDIKNSQKQATIAAYIFYAVLANDLPVDFDCSDLSFEVNCSNWEITVGANEKAQQIINAVKNSSIVKSSSAMKNGYIYFIGSKNKEFAVQWKESKDSELIGQEPRNYGKIEWGKCDFEKAKSTNTNTQNNSQQTTQKNTVQNRNAEKEKNPTEIKTIIVSTNRTDLTESGKLDKLTDEFEKKHNCKVEYKAYLEYENDIKQKMDENDYGDVLLIPTNLDNSELDKYFAPVGKYDSLKNKYRWADAKKASDNNVYGLAVGGSVSGILYNKKVWKDAGITKLPETQEEFLSDLKLIKKNTQAAPLASLYGDSWAILQWQYLVDCAYGSDSYKTELLNGSKDIFDKNGGFYKTYKLMYDIFSNPDLIDEPKTSRYYDNFEKFSKNEIGTVVAGSWGISSFGYHISDTDNLGYMPVPIKADDGKLYAQTTPDYCLGINKNSQNKKLAKAYISWIVNSSIMSKTDIYLPTLKSAKLPDYFSDFKNVTLFESNVKYKDFDDKLGTADIGLKAPNVTNLAQDIADTAIKGKGSEGFNSIIKKYRDKWKKAIKM